jgi:hypothetical protein
MYLKKSKVPLVAPLNILIQILTEARKIKSIEKHYEIVFIL